MITSILTLISGLFTLAGKIFEFMYAQKLIDAGKTSQQLEDLKGQINAAQEAIAVREAQRLSNERNGVPVNGEWDRDK